MQFVYAFFWFVRRGPLALGIVALAILALGYYLQVSENERNGQKLAALRAGPPAAVEIESFNRDRDATELREIVLHAQPVIDYADRLTIEGSSSDKHGFMVPLVAANAKYDNVILGIAFYSDSDFVFDDITPDLILRDMVGFGTFGPVVEFNGKIDTLGSWQDLTEEAFMDEGLTLSADAVIVWPYLDGREAAFTPSDSTIFGFMSKIAGVIGLLALAKLVFSGKPKEPDAFAALGEQATTRAQPALDDAPTTKGVPLWKQRSGLVDDAVNVPEPQPAPVMTSDFDASPVSKPRAPIGVRKIIIGVIAAVFVVLLISTISGLIGETLENDQIASIPTAEERIAETVAAYVVPTADPDRPFYEIDLAPIAQWFVTKWVLALAGDKDALMTLLMIGGGVLAFFVMIPLYLNIRRSLRPKTSARIGSMGIN